MQSFVKLMAFTYAELDQTYGAYYVELGETYGADFFPGY